LQKGFARRQGLSARVNGTPGLLHLVLRCHCCADSSLHLQLLSLLLLRRPGRPWLGTRLRGRPVQRTRAHLTRAIAGAANATGAVGRRMEGLIRWRGSVVDGVVDRMIRSLAQRLTRLLACGAGAIVAVVDRDGKVI